MGRHALWNERVAANLRPTFRQLNRVPHHLEPSANSMTGTIRGPADLRSAFAMPLAILIALKRE